MPSETFTLTRDQDKMRVTVLDDGRVKIETDNISMAARKSAKDMLSNIEQLLGGETIVEHKDGSHHHIDHGHDGHRH